MRRSLILAVTLAACGPAGAGAGSGNAGDGAQDVASNQNAPAPEPYAAPGQATAGGHAPAAGSTPSGSGSSREDAVALCGPVESYRHVAEYRCPDGSQPLNGDPSQGQGARVGNVGPNASGHIIDLYRVPCSSGPADVFIDMYGCAEMESLFGGP